MNRRHSHQLQHRAQRVRRLPRSLQLALAVVAIVLASPLLLLCALAIALTMGTPVLFRQARAGLDGRPFLMVKFRSMVDARDQFGNLLPDKERTPRIGALLRRLRIDELPELVNVLRGEMALVGPRPLLPITVELMGSGGTLRGSVRPGLTGWAQVNGNSRLDRDEKLALDLWYIRKRSFWLDLLILVRTLGVMLLGERISASSLEDARAYYPSRRC
jgi:lipopolysaccharide/colanic/teichoic acid biosynthesis glycosyltransferase